MDFFEFGGGFGCPPTACFLEQPMWAMGFLMLGPKGVEGPQRGNVQAPWLKKTPETGARG